MLSHVYPLATSFSDTVNIMEGMEIVEMEGGLSVFEINILIFFFCQLLKLPPVSYCPAHR